MAKLSARGRIELVRLSKETTDIPSDHSIVWERLTVALMSDGNLLEKRDVKFKPMAWETEPRPYTWGWKVKFKVKAGVDRDRVIQVYTSKGYSLVK